MKKNNQVLYIKIFSVAIACLLLSCKISLVPQYSAALEAQIQQGAKMTDMLYLEMLDAPAGKKNYALYSDKYLNAEAEINSILLQNQARPLSGDIIISVQKLHDYFVKAKEDHKAKDSLSNAELLIYNEQLKAFWKPVLVEEIALSKVK